MIYTIHIGYTDCQSVWLFSQKMASEYHQCIDNTIPTQTSWTKEQQCTNNYKEHTYLEGEWRRRKEEEAWSTKKKNQERRSRTHERRRRSINGGRGRRNTKEYEEEEGKQHTKRRKTTHSDSYGRVTFCFYKQKVKGILVLSPSLLGIT